MVVHGLLKRGVYKPVRSLSQPFPKYSRFTASMAAFIASGVFHEWLLSGELSIAISASLSNDPLTVLHRVILSNFPSRRYISSTIT